MLVKFTFLNSCILEGYCELRMHELLNVMLPSCERIRFVDWGCIVHPCRLKIKIPPIRGERAQELACPPSRSLKGSTRAQFLASGRPVRAILSPENTP